MKNKFKLILSITTIVFITGCAPTGEQAIMKAEKTFGEDVQFLKNHADAVVLEDPTSDAKIVVSGSLQGKVMTSTADGDNGKSFGWINYDLIASGTFEEHINVFGGEDRFWIGPEGGQYSIFFGKDVPFDLDHWFTPAPIDTESWNLAEHSQTHAEFCKIMQLANFSGAKFNVLAKRTVRMLDKNTSENMLGTTIGNNVKMVAFETDNTLTNTGTNAWTKETGLLSIWILGMFKHSPGTTVVVPFITGDEATLGKIVNDAYFGALDESRLQVDDSGFVFFKGDGQYRSKIGVGPKRAKDVFGSYDEDSQTLTIVKYTLPGDTTQYVNSLWKMQPDPYNGDVINSYNDGPSEPGAEPFGPFYELESSSPAVELEPGQSFNHKHTTFHFTGNKEQLDAISKNVLGISIDDIAAVF